MDFENIPDAGDEVESNQFVMPDPEIEDALA